MTEKTLTMNQMKVVHYLSEGKTAKEMAALLKISHRTVTCHIIAAKKKLGLDSTSALKGWYHLLDNKHPLFPVILIEKDSPESWLNALIKISHLLEKEEGVTIKYSKPFTEED